MLNKFFKRNMVKDISFGNIFFKKFVIGLCVLAILTVPLLAIVIPFMEEHNELKIDNTMSLLALNLAKVYNSEIDQHVKDEVAHCLMSTSVEELLNNRFTTDASIALYDIKQQKIIIRSSETAILKNCELFNAESLDAMCTDGIPPIAVDKVLLDFYEQHRDETVYVKGLYVLNNVIFPSNLVTLNDKYQVVDSAQIEVPSITTEKVYDDCPVLQMIGNKQSDIALNLISNHSFEVVEGSVSDQKSIQVQYPSITDSTNLKIKTIHFVIDDTTYQIDYAYRVNFWAGAIGYVLLIELAAVLACAAFAFVNTKETLEYKH